MMTMAPLVLGYALRHCDDCPIPEGGETPIGAWILGAVAAEKGEGRDTCPFTGPMGEEWLSGWRSWRAHQRRAAR